MNEEMVLTFFDLRRFVLRHCFFVLKGALFITGCVCLFFFTQPLSYKHESTLRTLSPPSAPSFKMQELLPQFAGGLNADLTTSFLLSKNMVTQVVEEMGLQVFCPVDSWIVRMAGRVKNRILFEFSEPSTSQEMFPFRHVRFSKEKTERLYLRLIADGEYELWTLEKQLVGRAKIGSPLQCAWGELTLCQAPQQSKVGTFYPLKLFSTEKTLQFWLKKLKVFPSKLSKAIVQMEVTYPDRYLGAFFLNTWMDLCRAFMQKEQDEIYKAQIHALESQSEELAASYNQALFNHAHYLEKNIQEGRAVEYLQEVESLLGPKQKYLSRLRDVDLELNLLGNQTDAPLQEIGEFAGLNASLVSELLTDHNKQKNLLQSQLNELYSLKKHIVEPDFEVTSLGSILEDQVIRDLVAKASDIALQLQDKGNRNVREQERLLEEIASQKSFLSQYLSQTIELKTSRVELLNTKVSSLKKVLEKLLKSEQSLLGHKLEDLKVSMQQLPQQWYQESLLSLKKEQVAALLKGTEQLIASLHMEKSASRGGVIPLDLAIIPDDPQSWKLTFIALITLFVSGVGLYGLLFFKTLYEGFPVSREMLQGLGFSVCGSISSTLTDRGVLNRLVDFISSGTPQVVVYIRGEHSDDLSNVAISLSRRGYKTLTVLSLSSSSRGVQEIESCGTYDRLFLEGSNQVESFCSISFKKHLSTLKEQYDYILLDTSTPPSHADSVSFLGLVDCAVLTVQHERKEDLAPYFKWVNDHLDKRVTFICVQNE